MPRRSRSRTARLLPTNARGLLISWATPALRRPIDASFSDWASIAVIFWRSVWSRIEPRNWTSSDVSIAEIEISRGNRTPSLRQPCISRVRPTILGSRSSSDRRKARPWSSVSPGKRRPRGWPSTSAAEYPKVLSAERLNRVIRAEQSATTTASRLASVSMR